MVAACIFYTASAGNACLCRPVVMFITRWLFNQFSSAIFFLIAFSYFLSATPKWCLVPSAPPQNANPKLLPCVYFPVRVTVISRGTSNLKLLHLKIGSSLWTCIYSLLHLHPHPPFNPSLYWCSQGVSRPPPAWMGPVPICGCPDKRWRGVKVKSEHEWRLSLSHYFTDIRGVTVSHQFMVLSEDWSNIGTQLRGDL